MRVYTLLCVCFRQRLISWRIVRFEEWLVEALPSMIQYAAHMAAVEEADSPAEALSRQGYDFGVAFSPADLNTLHELDWVRIVLRTLGRSTDCTYALLKQVECNVLQEVLHNEIIVQAAAQAQYLESFCFLRNQVSGQRFACCAPATPQASMQMPHHGLLHRSCCRPRGSTCACPMSRSACDRQ